MSAPLIGSDYSLAVQMIHTCLEEIPHLASIHWGNTEITVTTFGAQSNRIVNLAVAFLSSNISIEAVCHIDRIDGTWFAHNCSVIQRGQPNQQWDFMCHMADSGIIAYHIIDVTKDTWPNLQQAGWSFVCNITWPMHSNHAQLFAHLNAHCSTEHGRGCLALGQHMESDGSPLPRSMPYTGTIGLYSKYNDS